MIEDGISQINFSFFYCKQDYPAFKFCDVNFKKIIYISKEESI